ncbi:hypothetical protein [Vibrio ziniensis]|uniref:Uncharacterized protein n=1 Tax=Vibrio ziniensis TaxID=2711221 RepID=A0A6G7CQ65_9VIBR|nr:hypothetical protein [Vibrio ziniensis]QIH44224.1 hypothetical protein G5S32_19930 [Vibrio ziniensis]
MVKDITNIIIVTVITFFINFGLNYTLNKNNGFISLGSPMKIAENYYKPIEITNYSKSTIDGLFLTVNYSFNIDLISVSNPILIESKDNFLLPIDKYLFQFSNISPNSKTRILIPLDINKLDCCTFSNAKELGFYTESDSDIENPLRKILLDTLLQTLIYGIIYGFFYLKSRSDTNSVRNRLKEVENDIDHKTRNHKAEIKDNNESLNKKLESAKEISDGIRKELSELKVMNKRLRYILIKRLVEHKKEINFWRELIKKILVKNVKPELLEHEFKSISRILGTNSTHSNIEKEADEFDDLSEAIESVNIFIDKETKELR